jgi:anti-sigma factor RsiW
MKITRDVVKDLLPAYSAGEASSDTRALVEEWLRSDAELSAQVRAADRITLPEVPSLPPSIEKQALDRTRRRLRWRSILLGVAVYVSTLPLSITFGSSGYEGLLIKDWPERIVVFAMAIALWVLYWRVCRRMRVSGL